jgi:DNA polymerase III alpha subunit
MEMQHFHFRLTFEMLSGGDTRGVFQAESEEMSHILSRFKPSTFKGRGYYVPV